MGCDVESPLQDVMAISRVSCKLRRPPAAATRPMASNAARSTNGHRVKRGARARRDQSRTPERHPRIDSCRRRMSITSHAHRWLSGALSRVAQSISQPVCPTITGVRGSTTTGIVLLDRWTWHCSERAEHTAVALMRTQNRSTARALIEELTRCDGHCLGRPMAALRAGQDAFQLDVTHRQSAPWPGSLLP
jgi:hypothetical protein